MPSTADCSDECIALSRFKQCCRKDLPAYRWEERIEDEYNKANT